MILDRMNQSNNFCEINHPYRLDSILINQTFYFNEIRVGKKKFAYIIHYRIKGNKYSL